MFTERKSAKHHATDTLEPIDSQSKTQQAENNKRDAAHLIEKLHNISSQHLHNDELVTSPLEIDIKQLKHPEFSKSEQKEIHKLGLTIILKKVWENDKIDEFLKIAPKIIKYETIEQLSAIFSIIKNEVDISQCSIKAILGLLALFDKVEVSDLEEGIRSFLKIAPAKRIDALEKALLFNHFRLSPARKIAILRVLSWIPKEKHDEHTLKKSSKVLEGLPGKELDGYLDALEELAPAETIVHALPLMIAIEDPRLNFYDLAKRRADIFALVAMIPEIERTEEVLNAASCLFLLHGKTTVVATSFFNACKWIPEGEWDDIFTKTKHLRTCPAEEFPTLLWLTALIPKDERTEDHLNITLTLQRTVINPHYFLKNTFVEALSLVSSRLRIDYIKKLQTLMAGIDPKEHKAIISLLPSFTLKILEIVTQLLPSLDRTQPLAPQLLKDATIKGAYDAYLQSSEENAKPLAKPMLDNVYLKTPPIKQA